MKSLLYLSIAIIAFNLNMFAQLETKTFLLTKDEYRLLEEKNELITKAIINAFGESSPENNYKLELSQVDAYNGLIKEFKYFPSSNNENKQQLKTKALNYSENYNIDFRVKIIKEKSVITESIKPYLDKKNTLILSLAIIGNPKTFVVEVRNKDKFKEVLSENTFAAKAFKKMFGDEQKTKYHLNFDRMTACLIKDLYNPKFTQEYEILQSKENYEKFSQNATSDEYDGAYILFKIPIIRKNSKITPIIETYLSKKGDTEEYISFYFCIPGTIKKQVTPSLPTKQEVKPLSTGIIRGQMLAISAKTAPIKNAKVDLLNTNNTVIQSVKTDEHGTFEFKDVDLESNYTIELPSYVAEENRTKVYIANINGELIKELTRSEQNRFSYRTIEADVYRLATMNENDVELTFLKQKVSNKNTILIQDFVYYDLNSFKISTESVVTLDKVIKILAENNAYSLEIISHTDARGDEAENVKLSQKRSESVLSYLIINGKIDSKRVTPFGLGESKPLNSCTNGNTCLENEFKMNRRTEFVFKRS